MSIELVQSTLSSIARLEAAGVKPARLTQPDFEKWHRFRRKLGWGAFIELLHEDLAGAFPVPFDIDRWAEWPALADDKAEALVRGASASVERDPLDFLRDCARLLGLPTAGAISDAPKVQAHHDALELPGSGGRVAAYLCSHEDALSFDRQFTFVVDSEAERVAIGLAAVELRANEPRIWNVDQLRDAVGKGTRFDRVLGLSASPLARELAELDLGEVRLV